MCAVVLINQVTTKFGGERGTLGSKNTSSFLAPALGDTWAHACTSRVMLYWLDGQRFAKLYKSPSRKTDTVPYCVVAEGVILVQSYCFIIWGFGFYLKSVAFINTSVLTSRSEDQAKKREASCHQAPLSNERKGVEAWSRGVSECVKGVGGRGLRHGLRRGTIR